MITFKDLPERDQLALHRAAGKRGAQISEVYTRPRPAFEWERRASKAAQWLTGVQELADVGCGSMTLRRLLPANIRYQGVDIVARDQDTLVLNLNERSLPHLGYNTAAALGVMEYLYDPERFLKSLRQFDQVVFSYCVRNLRLRRKTRLDRLWVNHLSLIELEGMIKTSGLSVVRRARLSFSEYLYILKPA